MHFVGFIALFIAFLLCLACAGVCLYMYWTGSQRFLRLVENGQLAALVLLGLASSVLLRALVGRDFSFQYVAHYTDTFLPFFYTITAFWAGQSGSFLFWTLCIAVCCLFFTGSAGYRRFSPQTRIVYWLLFLSVEAFFLLLLTGPSNPFLGYSPAPVNGNGLNPLLQHPGMIFHPPLLFIGYAGFTVPACLGLAAWVAGDSQDWLPVARTWTLVSWIFLTAGIVLGAWWAYMELGWGGYWAWDPVENASLIPWLASSAFIHTAVIQARRNALHRTNVFLIALTLFLCFFATYVVRSGVIDSLHAFPAGGIGRPLFCFLLAMLGTIVLIVAGGRPARQTRPMDILASRPGLLAVTAWFLLALAAVVLLGTMWPVISSLWATNPMGLDANFYNTVCLPLFVLLGVFLVFCPWFGWAGGVRYSTQCKIIGVLLLVTAGMLYVQGMDIPFAALGAASGIVVLISIAILFAVDKGARRTRTLWGAYGVHAGLALVILGVSFSGPYSYSNEGTLHKDETLQVGRYTFTYHGFEEKQTNAMIYLEAHLTASKEGVVLGDLRPQRRKYFNNPNIFAEVAVIPSLGEELYATILGSSEDGHAVVKITVNPLVNWVWIGSVLMCLFPVLILWNRWRPVAQASSCAPKASDTPEATGEVFTPPA